MEDDKQLEEQVEKQYQAYARREEIRKTALGLSFLVGVAALILGEGLRAMGFDNAARLCFFLTIPLAAMLVFAGLAFGAAGVMFCLMPGFKIAEMIQEGLKAHPRVAVPVGFIIYFASIALLVVAITHRPSANEYSDDCLLPGRYAEC